MAQQPIELILLKQWAGYISSPVWLMDHEGNLVFYNEPAESILGMRFDEAGVIHADELAERFTTTDLDGDPIPNEELPVVIALQKQVAAHLAFRIRVGSGSWREIAVTAVPIEGQAGRHLGAMALFWETGRK